MPSDNVSMKDVALRAGVSTATVSHVINNTSNVKKETKELVNKAITELDYRINPIARKLRVGQSKLVAFFVSNMTHYFYHEIGSAIEAVLYENGFDVFYINTQEDPQKELRQLELCRSEVFAGMIITPVNSDWSKLVQTVSTIPIVFIDRKPLHIRRDNVLITNALSGFNLTNELIRRGAKKLAFISSKNDLTIKMRVDGFKDSLEQNNIPLDQECIIFGTTRPKLYSELAIDPEWSEIISFLLNEKKVDCIICGNDLSAFGAITYFNKHNIKLQEDILFGTYDNAFWMNNLEEEVIAIEQNTRAIGEKAANLLLSRINKEPFVYGDYLIDTQLVSINKMETRVLIP